MTILSKISSVLPSLRPGNPYARPFSRLLSNRLTRGDIVLLKGKFEGEGGDVVQSKNRPYIVISSDKVMEITKRIALAPLSTASARFEYEIIIPKNEQTGIHQPSKVMANQVGTVFLEDGLVKIGSASSALAEIDQALAICFGNFSTKKQLEISRGDVVEIDFGSYVRSGIIVSNDLGNQASQIAMLAHSHRKNEAMNEFDLVVREERCKEELLVQCYMINTFNQGFIDKKGRITNADMERITAMLFKTLGITK